MRVHKFGGSCLGAGEGLPRLAGLLKPGDRAVVVSALRGVTDTLLALLEDTAPEPLLEDLQRGHRAALSGLADPWRAEAADRVQRLLGELRDALDAKTSPQGVDRDRILGFGERLAVVLVTAWLRAGGLAARGLAVGEAGLRSVRRGERAEILPASAERVRVFFAGRAELCVVPGFVVLDAADGWTTLGRGGSDTTATFLAAALGCPAVLWKDTPGLLTGDPRLVPDPFVVRHLHYEEVQELAQRGLVAIQAEALGPARAAGIPIEVRSCLEPEAPPTRIGSAPSCQAVVSSCRAGACASGGPRPEAEPPLAMVSLLLPESTRLDLAAARRALASREVAPLAITPPSPPQRAWTFLVRQGEERRCISALHGRFVSRGSA